MMRRPDTDHAPSRSDRKRADKPFQDLARQLAELTEDACRSLPASDDLKEEILAAVRIKAHGARNRQVKRLAAVLRRNEVEAAALGEVLSGRDAIHQGEVQVHRSLELLREQICDPDQAEAAVEKAVRRFPGLDGKELHRLSRAARTAMGTPDRRAFREIFRRLRLAQEDADGQRVQAEDE